MCLLDDFFVNLTTVTVHYALLAQAIPKKTLIAIFREWHVEFHFIGMQS